MEGWASPALAVSANPAETTSEAGKAVGAAHTVVFRGARLSEPSLSLLESDQSKD